MRTQMMTAFSLAVLLAGAAEAAQPQPADFETLVRQSRSESRDEWRSAAARLGERARGSAEERGRVWRAARVNTLGMKFAEVPSGSFVMGPDVHRVFDRQPAHPVEISRGYFVSVTEVTNDEMRRVIPEFAAHPEFSPDPDSPAVDVDAALAMRFCERLSALEGGPAYRLPTEAEWEYACRAGSTELFSFGADKRELPKYGWTAGRSNGRAARVALLKPNAWGLFDMHGNAVEWVSDFYSHSYYSELEAKGAAKDPRGPEGGASRVLRGGGWPAKEPLACTSTARMPFPLLGGRSARRGEPPLSCVAGFRVVREADRDPEPERRFARASD